MGIPKKSLKRHHAFVYLEETPAQSSDSGERNCRLHRMRACERGVHSGKAYDQAGCEAG